MIEFNKKDKNGRNILVRIVNKESLRHVDLSLKAEIPRKFLFIKWTKLTEIMCDIKFPEEVCDWDFRDYENWADDKIHLLNIKLLREERKEMVFKKISKGKF